RSVVNEVTVGGLQSDYLCSKVAILRVEFLGRHELQRVLRRKSPEIPFLGLAERVLAVQRCYSPIALLPRIFAKHDHHVARSGSDLEQPGICRYAECFH